MLASDNENACVTLSTSCANVLLPHIIKTQ